jgi:protein-S-isoprenylcysteine O-methyltransferase Ste14
MNDSMPPPVDLVLLILWALFLAWWWIPALWNRTPVKKAPSRFSFTRIAAMPAAIILAAVILADPWLATVRVLPDTFPVIVAGFLIFLSGLSFAIWARFHLGTNWSGRPAIRENHTLTRTGPYALVRNPIYTGFLTGILGTAIATGSLLAFFCMVIIFVGFLAKIRVEEEILAEEFGEEYREYRRRTKALVPWIV